VVLTARIEGAPALRTFASALHVLTNSQNMLALSAKHGTLVSFRNRPNIRLVRLAGIVTAYTRVELLAAEMFDGDYVERGMPMCALSQWCYGEAVNCRILLFVWRCYDFGHGRGVGVILCGQSLHVKDVGWPAVRLKAKEQ
jgi:hypothetical protein